MQFIVVKDGHGGSTKASSVIENKVSMLMSLQNCRVVIPLLTASPISIKVIAIPVQAFQILPALLSAYLFSSAKQL